MYITLQVYVCNLYSLILGQKPSVCFSSDPEAAWISSPQTALTSKSYQNTHMDGKGMYKSVKKKKTKNYHTVI